MKLSYEAIPVNDNVGLTGFEKGCTYSKGYRLVVYPIPLCLVGDEKDLLRLLIEAILVGVARGRFKCFQHGSYDVSHAYCVAKEIKIDGENEIGDDIIYVSTIEMARDKRNAIMSTRIRVARERRFYIELISNRDKG
ncbi:hypothetical protein HZH68_013617 [Vespula germanica]|uniref:Uncharacterized protein n=1 Tax=Vespula germanica TaxID=30212 RepID=A0A834JED9_VESGE|nr:hypothetical protein HZH68_013617 [Vespula germanica]